MNFSKGNCEIASVKQIPPQSGAKPAENKKYGGNKKPICKYYRYGECNKYGECRYGRGGCSGGYKNCQLLHPVLCRNSTRHGKCFDTNCKLTHLKGTIRFPYSENAASHGHSENNQQHGHHHQFSDNSYHEHYPALNQANAHPNQLRVEGTNSKNTDQLSNVPPSFNQRPSQQYSQGQEPLDRSYPFNESPPTNDYVKSSDFLEVKEAMQALQVQLAHLIPQTRPLSVPIHPVPMRPVHIQNQQYSHPPMINQNQ